MSNSAFCFPRQFAKRSNFNIDIDRSREGIDTTQHQTWVNKTVQEAMTIAATQEEGMVAEDHHQEVTLEEEVEATTGRRTTTTSRTMATTRTMLMLTMGALHPKAKSNIQPKISRAEQKI